jgi:hypothetical protein
MDRHFGDKDWKEPKFFEKFCEALCEMGALATADYARFFNPDLRVRVDVLPESHSVGCGAGLKILKVGLYGNL